MFIWKAEKNQQLPIDNYKLSARKDIHSAAAVFLPPAFSLSFWITDFKNRQHFQLRVHVKRYMQVANN
ncbi:MAG: hypothetical protein B6D61_12390 [Bacteroidetes bacterium 4484_249]|nr:MAG: hypothetical protein B6D61_12390 [Bacteroidetes bacterium 4484_249]